MDKRKSIVLELSFQAVARNIYCKQKKHDILQQSHNSHKYYPMKKTIFCIIATLTLSPFTNLQAQAETSCALDTQRAYKTPSKSSVYYITQDCTKQRFPNARLFFTYFNAWSQVKSTTQSNINNIPIDPVVGRTPQGPNYNAGHGALVKSPYQAETYLLLQGKKYWITTEAAFASMGLTFDMVEDVSVELLEKYDTAENISIPLDQANATIPSFLAIKYNGDPKIYILVKDPQTQVEKKHHVTNEQVFYDLNYRIDRPALIPNNLQFETGAPITKASEFSVANGVVPQEEDEGELTLWKEDRKLYKTTKLNTADGKDLVWNVSTDGCTLDSVEITLPETFAPVKHRLTWRTSYGAAIKTQMPNPDLRASNYTTLELKLQQAHYEGDHIFADKTVQADGGRVVWGFVSLGESTYTPENIRHITLSQEDLEELNTKIEEKMQQKEFESEAYTYDGKFYLVTSFLSHNLHPRSSAGPADMIHPLRAGSFQISPTECR